MIEGESDIGAHFHKNFELIVVEKGACTVRIADTGYTVCTGEAVFILPFYVHSVKTEADSRIRRTTFAENIGLSFVISFKNSVPSSPVFSPTETTLNYYLNVMNRDFGSEPLRFIRVDPPFRRIMAKSLIYIIGSEFIASVDFYPESESNSFRNLIERITKYIVNNYKNDISLSTMAKEFGYNYQYLSKLLNNTFGINFKTLLNQHRLKHAYILMLDTNMRFSDIAFESGFQSIRSFNQICLDTYGKTPKQLRSDYLGKTKSWQ